MIKRQVPGRCKRKKIVEMMFQLRIRRKIRKNENVEEDEDSSEDSDFVPEDSSSDDEEQVEEDEYSSEDSDFVPEDSSSDDEEQVAIRQDYKKIAHARSSALGLSRRFLSPSILRSIPRAFSPSSSSQFCAPVPVIPTAMVSSARSSGSVAYSASNSAGSTGSPSGRAGPSKGAAAAAASGSTVARRFNDLEIQGDDAPSLQPAASKKKKKGTRVVGPDKGNRGLRQFSMKVCEKVEGKGRTTYNEVADELVAEFADPNSNIGSPDPDNPNTQQHDEKNIRTRVYDALNVLIAMDIISKDKKEIQWKGLPRASLSDIDKFKAELIGLKGRIETIDKKIAYLQELHDQYVGLQNLVERNEQLYCSGDAPSGKVALPFKLFQTRRHATVEVEISVDMQLVHFDFNSTPFELHDDSFVLKAMGFSGKEETDDTMALVANGVECSGTASIYGHQSPQPARPNGIRLRTSPPIPGIHLLFQGY